METGLDWEYLVEHTEMYSGDDLANVCRDASMMPLRREMIKGEPCDSQEDVRAIHDRVKDIPISMRDFKEALDTVKPTNSSDRLERYHQWAQDHASS